MHATANGVHLDSELHGTVVNRVSRLWEGGTAGNHYGMLKRASAILKKILLCIGDDDNGPVGNAMPA